MIWQDFVQNRRLQDYPKLAILAWGVRGQMFLFETERDFSKSSTV